jgi:hypothetical protein
MGLSERIALNRHSNETQIRSLNCDRGLQKANDFSHIGSIRDEHKVRFDEVEFVKHSRRGGFQDDPADDSTQLGQEGDGYGL